MALEDLPTTELAHRLARIKHGVGDPVKNNTLFAACAKRLSEVDTELNEALRVSRLLTEQLAVEQSAVIPPGTTAKRSR